MTAAKPNTSGRAISWALSLGGVVAAVGLRWLLDPFLGDTLPLVTLFGAVALGVWVSGYAAAIIVAIAGYLACAYLFIEPRASFLGSLVGLSAYLFTCTIIVVLGELMRTAQSRASTQGELLRVTLRSIGDAVITTDVGGRVTYLNAVAEALTGWSDAEARGRPLEDVFRIVNEDTRQLVENPAARALREGDVVGIANHTALLARNGAEWPIDDSAAPIRDETGAVSGCVLIFRDVSRQREAQKEAASRLLAARTLAAIVESSEVAIVGKGLDSIIRSWNGAAERLFGYTAAEAIGKHISLVIPPERLHEEDRIIAKLKAGERIEHFETERVRADGRRVQVSLTISPIRDDDGNVVGASKMARDITREREAERERQRLEDDLRKLAADLSEADRRKDQFLATLSHELRGPLAPLSNVLEIWKRSADAQLLAPARATMERQLGQLVRLVDDLLDLNRITHDRFELRPERMELGAAIRQAVETCRPLADSMGHTLDVDLPAELIWLRGDAARLAQVFGNLINNACKYTSPGGRISIGAQQHGGDAIVTVSDTGIGIPPDKLETVFGMFEQLDRSTEGSRGGLGIGLTLVKQLVQMHGGTVEAQSAGPGLGSRFVVRVPALDPAAGVVEAAGSEPPTAVARRRVLVVDDNEDSAQSLAMLLQTEGHETFTAHDGVSAIQSAEEHRPDVVLLDVGLPKLSGHEVCRQIRSRPWGRDVLLIAVTGWGQAEDRRKSSEAGFDGHLVKPIRYEAVARMLRDCLHRSSTDRETA